MRVGWRDVLISAGTLALLLAALVAVDERARTSLAATVYSAASPGSASHAGGFVRDAVWVVVVAARDQSIAHAPLVIFVAAALLLVVFMVRT